jgi:hypothetical protein
MFVTNLLLASLVALGPALALPSPPAKAQGEIFSFSKWIDGIIANPDEVVSLVNGTHTGKVETSTYPIPLGVDCDSFPNKQTI